MLSIIDNLHNSVNFVMSSTTVYYTSRTKDPGLINHVDNKYFKRQFEDTGW